MPKPWNYNWMTINPAEWKDCAQNYDNWIPFLAAANERIRALGRYTEYPIDTLVEAADPANQQDFFAGDYAWVEPGTDITFPQKVTPAVHDLIAWLSSHVYQAFPINFLASHDTAGAAITYGATLPSPFIYESEFVKDAGTQNVIPNVHWINSVVNPAWAEPEPARYSRLPRLPWPNGPRRICPLEIRDLTATGSEGQIARLICNGVNDEPLRPFSGRLYRRTSGVWVLISKEEEIASNLEAALIDTFGFPQKGDIIGPWMMNDLRDALNACTKTAYNIWYGNPDTTDQYYRYGNTSTNHAATKAVDDTTIFTTDAASEGMSRSVRLYTNGANWEPDSTSTYPFQGTADYIETLAGTTAVLTGTVPVPFGSDVQAALVDWGVAGGFQYTAST